MNAVVVDVEFAIPVAVGLVEAVADAVWEDEVGLGESERAPII